MRGDGRCVSEASWRGLDMSRVERSQGTNVAGEQYNAGGFYRDDESVTPMRLFAGTPFDRPPTCERCGKLESECACPPLPAARIPPGEQTARLAVEKRRKGKVVTVVRGLSAEWNDLPALLSELKNRCGAGGAIQDDTLEIQGRQVERVGAVLRDLGYGVKG